MKAATLEETLKRPVRALGTTEPKIYVCNSCAAAIVEEGHPVCDTCEGKLTATPYRLPWAGVAVMLAGLIALFAALIWLTANNAK